MDIRCQECDQPIPASQTHCPHCGRPQPKVDEVPATVVARGPPQTLGGYVIEELLGEGGMGKVFKAKHLRLGRPAALKVIHENYLHSDPQSAARFVREGRAIARLKHPNIVTAYDASVEEGVHFLAMEYVDGVTLAQLVADRGPLSIDQSLDFLVQAAEALECAHRHGVVHRDIKPTNLMVERSTHRIKVLDLGIARLASEKEDEACAKGLTATGEFMGTSDYLAPEQASSAMLADHRVDIYSLGCTLYLMITGKKLYEHAGTRFEQVRAHLEDPIPAMNKYRPNVPAAVMELYELMVKKDPDERLQSMAEVVNRARQIRGDLFGDSRRSAADATMEPARATDSYVGAAGATRDVALAGAQEEEPDIRVRRPSNLLWKVALVVASVALAAIVIGLILRQSPTKLRMDLLNSAIRMRRAIAGVTTPEFVATVRVSQDGRPPVMQNIDTTVTDKELAELAKADVELVNLDLSQTGIDDEELKRLAEITELQYLSLYGCERLTDEAFRPLQDLVNLRTLDLRGTRLSGQGLKQLPDAPIEKLMLDGVPPTLDGDAVVKVAERFRVTLRVLTTQGITFTPEQKERLQPWMEPESSDEK